MPLGEGMQNALPSVYPLNHPEQRQAGVWRDQRMLMLCLEEGEERHWD